ncbi:hypothetical protein ACQ856_11810 [Mycolicibacterium psychrotolerans]|uniref:hypothetical protein n=1 Tax=Mycolicibacterium psychrotolerans TaxID=216929 RepID=UPI003D67BD3B
MEPVGEAGLFETSEAAPPPTSVGSSVEQRMDVLTDAARSSAHLAGNIRTMLNALGEGASRGSLSSASSQIKRAAESVSELSAALVQLRVLAETIGVDGAGASVDRYTEELVAALAKRGIAVDARQAPYCLVYPAWFKVGPNKKGFIDVIVNGDPLDTLRPSIVADIIHSTVSEPFEPTQFADLLQQVRKLLQKTGAPGQSINLDVVYDLLALQPSAKKGPRRRAFTKAEFLYSVHRLAEADGPASSQLYFPPANRPDNLFFTRDGDNRRYLMVEFEGSSTQ